MRSTRRAVSRSLPVILAFGLLLAAHPRGAAAAVLDPECPVYRGEPVPAGFAGCAELEARVRDTASFATADGFRLDLYEAKLDEFFKKLCHRNPETGWVRDKRVRDTGPYVGTLAAGQWTDVAYHGTHQPVVIWYDATMYEWLKRSRPAGEEARPGADPTEPIPDGAIMVKEMFPAPAARCAAYDPETLEPSPEIGVALMIRDNRGSRDGWFWGVWWKGTETSPGFNPDWPAGAAKGNRLPFMGFGQYCMNCHASAVDNLTFADLKNVQGEPGRPNVYLSQNFVFESSLAAESGAGQHRAAVDTADDPLRHDQPLAAYNPAVTARFTLADPPADAGALMMPSQTYDNVWVSAGGPTAESEFVTSDQCIGCHDAGSTGLQFDMTAPDPALGKLLNLSPYATWRTSPMGLGGRDPIFFAQLASETQTFHADQSEVVQDVCLGCHGIMGQRQFKIAHGSTPEDCAEPRLLFTRDRVNAVPYPSDPAQNPELASAPYGGLARDGISCTACHRMALTDEEVREVRSQPQNRCVTERQELLNPDNEGFARTFTGSYFVGSPTELKGPFEEPRPKPMDHAMGIQPVFDDATISSSELCGTCHTVHLPIFDGDKTLGYTYEQTTYPEWAFSAYRTGTLPGGGELPLGAGARAESCQACHMRRADPETGRYRSKIASIQEYSNFPAADFTLPPEEIDLEVRDGFARHTLVGLNVFLLEMAQQFPDVLGLRTQDPMLGSKGLDPVLFTERAMLEQASNDTAQVAVTDLRRDGETLSARVTVTNLAGHKLPSGVGFRRAFLEVAVLGSGGELLWASGRTDGAGVIVDERGEPVAGELWWTADCSGRLPGTPHQRHYQEITAQGQVQIYQELVTSPAPVADPSCGHHATPGGQLTTSFLSICGHVKDNRLLPAGFLGMEDRVRIARALGDGAALGDRAGIDLAEDAGPNAVGDDPDYVHGGGDSLVYRADLSGIPGEPAYVRATLYYQAIPPFYLQDRFCTAKGPDTDRLYYLTGHLDLAGTRAEDWKLEVVGSGLVEVPAGVTAARR